MNETEKEITELWRRQLGDMNTATFDPANKTMFIHTMSLLKEEHLIELEDFIGEVLQHLARERYEYERQAREANHNQA